VYVVAGRKAAQWVARLKRELVAEFSYKDAPEFAEARAISKFAQELFLSGQADAVDVVFTNYVNTLTQKAELRPLLPLGRLQKLEADLRGNGAPDEIQSSTSREFGFEPAAPQLLGNLLPHYLNYQVYQMLLEAKASEHSARMVAMKSATDNAEELIKNLSRIMNRAHGFWSVGFFTAALLGSLCAKLGFSPQWQLGMTVLIVGLANWVLLSRLVPYPDRPQTGEPVDMPRFARPTLPILWLVMISFSAMTLEGAGIDWSSIYMRDVFGLSPAWAGLAVATCAVAQALVRFNADRFVERYSPVAVARTALCTLALAVVLVFFAPHPVVAYVGFALMGAGNL
jgi:hypothetical protein